MQFVGNEELKKKILEVLNSEDRGFWMDELVAEIDEDYDIYSPKQFNFVINELILTDITTYEDMGTIHFRIKL